MADTITIRYATKEDVPTILALIQELATFEKALSSVHATVDSLTNTLSFPLKPNPSSHLDFTPGFARTFVILGSPGDGKPAEIAGMALFFTNYSTWRGAPGVYLEDLYVRPAFRRRGYAGKLLKALARETVRLGGQRLEWSCLRWNEGALGLYASLGAERMEEWVQLRLDGEKLTALATSPDV